MRLTVEEPKEISYIQVHSLWRLLWKLRYKFSYIFDSSSFILTVIMEDFFGQISDDLVCELRVLSLGHDTNEFWQWLGEIFLVIK